MPRSDPGLSTGLPPTSTVPDVAGYCGGRPAMRRSTVDFPHPDGPRMVTNSIFSGMSSTTNDTSLMAVKPLSYVFVTRSNSTTGGAFDADFSGAAGLAEPDAAGWVTRLPSDA